MSVMEGGEPIVLEAAADYRLALDPALAEVRAVAYPAAPPDPDGWFLYRSRCTWASGGYAEVQATLWSQSGPAVARIRQLVAVFG